MEKERIYLDNAATTQVDSDVVKSMLPYFSDIYAVASSQFSHTPGILAKEGVDEAREIIAKKILSHPEEIVFTSGGTESCNLAIKGTALAFQNKKNHIITSRIEHNAVLHTCQYLEKEGYRVTYIDVDDEGFIDLDQLRESITNKTFLVTIQHGNQEIGTIQPIAEIGEFCRDKGVLFHTDACLSFTHMDLDVSRLNVDLMTLSSHKIHGPKGVGALYVRKGTPTKKMNHGGYHEFDLRPGTENVPGIVGFGKAVELAKPEHVDILRSLQEGLFQGFDKEVKAFKVNGPKDMTRRLPGNVNVSFNSVEGESVVLHLDMKGIAVITGSACFSRSLEPSHVMMAMGFSHERAHGSIRFTLSRFNKMYEIERVVKDCKEVVEALRRISPLRES